MQTKSEMINRIAELAEENERLKGEILKFRWDNPYFDLYNNVVKQRDMWEQKSEQYKSCLQEIKEYLNTLSGIDNDFVNTETYLRILDLITKAEEE